jgi:putative ABC transport system permease protein
VVRARPDRIASLQGVFQTSVADLTVRDTTLTLDSFAHGFSGFRQQFSTPLLALVVMAVLLMLIASANVANLLLARAATRQREIATRMALGAGRARLVHQMLTESVLLVAMATVAAILFANWVGDALVRTVTATTEGPSPFAAALDFRVLGFTAAIALGSVVIFGLVPAWRTTRLDVISGLGSARGVVGNVAGRPARVIVILQVALSLVLVVGTGLMVRSFQKLLALDLGFERSQLLSVGLDQRLAGTSNLDQLHDRVLRAVGTVPSVEEAALAMCGLQSGCRARESDIVVEGYVPRTDEDISFVVNAVTPGYFSTVGTRLLAGRAFTDRDHATAPKVAVVNMTLARKYFGGGEQALGRRFGQSAPDVAIVGIVEDARSLSVREPAVPAAFFPLVQRGSLVRSLEVRTKGSPEQAVMAVRRTLAAAAPELLIERVDSMDERVRHGLARERLVLFLTSGFGTLALGLAAIGLFGVLSFSVARRTSEFGVRMALGASRSQIRWGVIREAQWLVLCGVLLGVPVALLGGHLASALFFGVSPFDVPTLLITALMLAGVALVCAVIPAMRASRVDPIVALRQD